MANTTKPFKMTLRAYQVGFGDCFLLTFHYKDDRDRNVLIDFGSKRKPKGYEGNVMVDVATDIHEKCGGRLDLVVATHRHQDHISGFATASNGKGSGDIIASCKVGAVIQPWTEHPDAKDPDLKAPGISVQSKAFAMALNNMHSVADAALSEVAAKSFRMMGASEVETVADNNTKNASAVNNLFNMSARRLYVSYGSKPSLKKELPGVSVRFLGPPTLEDNPSITSEGEVAEEFWALQSGAGQVAARRRALFRNADRYTDFPSRANWFVARMRAVRGSQLKGIVHAIDGALNNTSLIILFTVKSKKLLFPGDAEIENWSYALKQPGVKKLLSSVNLYKVGHHGSTNATPRQSLWENFKYRGKAGKFRTVISTMKGVYPGKKVGSEVPRTKLIGELKANSEYHSTEDVKSPGLCEEIEFLF
ncbi:MAG: hypothetical protein WCF57_19170 [Pyrinomonadaceae bacterium]